MRAVIVGASSGLGRCIAAGLGQDGAQVALLARRKDRLADAAAEAGDGAVAVECDVTDEASCQDAIAQAADALGGIDALVYATGVSSLSRLADIDAATWRWTFDTNVIGAALVTAAALPHLEESRGVAAYLSSVSASLTGPWPGLAAYAASKAALDKLVEAWRTEHPTVGFTRVIVGDCAGGEGDSMTGFSESWDHALMGEIAPLWVQQNLISGALLDVNELVQVMRTVLAAGSSASIPSVTVTPRRPG
jgi:NAD(P)-dependent dehydrogenase (short-subunit alcohol dehydrogenase family)